MTSNPCLQCRSWGAARLSVQSVFLGLVAVALFFAAADSRAGGSPFEVQVRELKSFGKPRIEVVIRIPTGHYIYADRLRVRSEDGTNWTSADAPAPKSVFDVYSEEPKDVFDKDFAGIYEWDGEAVPASVIVELQGCDQHVCFFPEEHRFSLTKGAASVNEARTATVGSGSASSVTDWRVLASQFEVVGWQSGYLAKDDFLRFVNDALRGKAVDDAITARLHRAGPWLGGLLIILGGLALNLTPCVLPMIPINLAIIGAGARSGSKRRGFALGLVYGLGMALVYGVLGIVAVFTGSTFGALNASPWFNAGIAILFVFLALAAFEVILIDFSRFQPRGALTGATSARFGTVFFLGGVAALLAGACVAPVVISVLVLTSSLVSKGYWFAAFLPFLLGFGMALPWPFAGAGLALLPRPGPWMKWVNRAFGILILGFAWYYGHTAWRLFRSESVVDTQHVDMLALAPENQKLAAEMARALRDNKPVFIDFWATWCKNCIAMEKTTFRDPEVMERLRDLVVIKYQAEHPDARDTKPVLQHFRVGGLPTYVLLRPVQNQGG